jgi:hypothetical protein
MASLNRFVRVAQRRGQSYGVLSDLLPEMFYRGFKLYVPASEGCVGQVIDDHARIQPIPINQPLFSFVSEAILPGGT